MDDEWLLLAVGVTIRRMMRKRAQFAHLLICCSLALGLGGKRVADLMTAQTVAHSAQAMVRMLPDLVKPSRAGTILEDRRLALKYRRLALKYRRSALSVVFDALMQPAPLYSLGDIPAHRRTASAGSTNPEGVCRFLLTLQSQQICLQI